MAEKWFGDGKTKGFGNGKRGLANDQGRLGNGLAMAKRGAVITKGVVMTKGGVAMAIGSGHGMVIAKRCLLMACSWLAPGCLVALPWLVFAAYWVVPGWFLARSCLLPCLSLLFLGFPLAVLLAGSWLLPGCFLAFFCCFLAGSWLAPDSFLPAS